MFDEAKIESFYLTSKFFPNYFWKLLSLIFDKKTITSCSRCDGLETKYPLEATREDIWKSITRL